MLILYIGLLTLLHIPAFQRKLGEAASSYLSTYLGTSVSIGSIDAGFLNQLVINDINIKDLQGKQTLNIQKSSVRIEILPLLRGEIELSALQLFGLDAKLNRPDPTSPLNIQFIIDKFSSKPSEDKEPVKLEFGTVVIRNGHLSYDILSAPETPGKFNASHLSLSDMELVTHLHSIKPDSLDVQIDELCFKEENIGLTIDNLHTHITTSEENLTLQNTYLSLGKTRINSGIINAGINSLNSKKISISGDVYDTQICPSDFSCFSDKLSSLNTLIYVKTYFFYNPSRIYAESLQLHDNDYIFSVDADILVDGLDLPTPSVDVKCREASIKPSLWQAYSKILPSGTALTSTISKLGTISTRGTFSYNSDEISTTSFISSDLGEISVDGIFQSKNYSIKGHIVTNSLNLLPLLPETGINNLTTDMGFDLNIGDLADISGLINGSIANITYKDYNLSNIAVGGKFNKDSFDGQLSVSDPKLDLDFNGQLSGLSTKDYNITSQLRLNKFTPSQFKITGNYAQNTYTLSASADIRGKSLTDMTGYVEIDNISISGPSTNFSFENISLNVRNNSGMTKDIELTSPIVNARIQGDYDFKSIATSLKGAVNALMPITGNPINQLLSTNDQFSIALTLQDHPFLHSFIKAPYSFSGALNVNGTIDSKSSEYNISADVDEFTYDQKSIYSPHIEYNSHGSNCSLFCKGTYMDNANTYSASLSALCKEHDISSDITLHTEGSNPLDLSTHISGTVDLGSSSKLAHLALSPTTVQLLSRSFTVESRSLDIYRDHLEIEDLKVDNEGRYLTINGILSNNPSDRLIADLNGTKMGSLFEVLGASVRNLDGFVYGKCEVSNILSSPKIDANLTVSDFMYKDLLLGNAYITANWDNKETGMRLRCQVIGNDYESENRLALVNGYIYPDQKEVDLSATFKNIDAIILEKLIGRTFRSIIGKVDAQASIRGPFSDIQILGEGYADAELTLRATHVGYKVSPSDRIQITTSSFTFNNIHIKDKYGHTNVINGVVGHKGFKNFSYTFDMNLDNLLLYEEDTFNSDKFKGRVFADGEFHLDGSDGHPLYINANITPTKGSEFCYDAATPDAITRNSFLQFKEQAPDDSLLLSMNIDPGWYWSVRDSLLSSTSETPVTQYRGDIFMSIGIRMNPNCAVKLRMDNVEDGYITTYGTGNIQAEYHNKGTFTLNGTYNIQSGRYRLYLQDIIYRDLELQRGSEAVFNGSPFDADIHLICWYTLNSVPLSDLTSSMLTQNNRVKVICVLDITGQLGNMAFNFDINLPNVSDETRQIVRSYISTEEEMNKQMIYLLGFGRFFTDEYARATGEGTSNQAVNNLLSSTLSGQINQILSNAIGTDSKWNFGTGLSTGERGWEDMDVEGNLSGHLLDDRLLINGNFGYRDNAMTNTSTFVGDFDVKWRLSPNGNTYVKAYNLTNDRYFTKSTLNTQGIGITYQKDFESWKDLFKRRKRPSAPSEVIVPDTNKSDSVPATSDFLIIKPDTTTH